MEPESQGSGLHRGLPGIAEVNGDAHDGEEHDFDASILTRSFKLKLSGKIVILKAVYSKLY